jgi:hypothetical protein
MDYIYCYYIVVVAMVHYLLHLYKTHVSNNKKQEQWKGAYEKDLGKGTILYYAILRANEIKRN